MDPIKWIFEVLKPDLRVKSDIGHQTSVSKRLQGFAFICHSLSVNANF